eukprot:GHVH01006103.1.p1 GENE.GHVH01006103.1~~GHVH01006103.1.p1  ORF type:complete len:461 (+),score=38.79 GHVH01006103.1:328-1710(+)
MNRVGSLASPTGTSRDNKILPGDVHRSDVSPAEFAVSTPILNRLPMMRRCPHECHSESTSRLHQNSLSPDSGFRHRTLNAATDRAASEYRLSPDLPITFSDLACILPSPINFQAPPYRSNTNCDDYPPEKLRYDVPPAIPLRRTVRRLLQVTEFPFVILWAFFAYWTVILCFSIRDTTRMMWLSALFAGLLVGVALNANAYKYIIKPKTRSRAAVRGGHITLGSDSVQLNRDRDVEDATWWGPGEFPLNQEMGSRYDFRGGVTFPTAAINEDEEAQNYADEHASAQRSNLMKLVVRFPRFFNQLVTTKRQCVRQSPLQRLENNATSERKPMSATMPHILNSSMNDNRPMSINAFSSGMNSLTKLARDWSIFSDTLEWELDIPTMIRFFIIPFAVSSISGMTSDEDKYVLVFPKDNLHLAISLAVPFSWVFLLAVIRFALLLILKVTWRWKVVFLNGCLVH